MNILYTSLLFSLGIFLCRPASAQISNTYTTAEKLPKLKIERTMIFSPETEWLYAHHASITSFKGKLYAIWSNGMKDEDNPGQRVVISSSADFKHWSAPKQIAFPAKTNDTLNVLTAAGFHVYKNALTVYYGEYTRHKTNTHLWAITTADGEHWGAPKDQHVPVNSNHGPQAIKGGRLIISGNFTFPYTDDPAGLSGWTLSSFYPAKLYKEDNPSTFYKPAEESGFPPLCEGSFFQTSDEKLHMLMRVTGKGWRGKLWLTESRDRGSSWSKPVETKFSDNDSKFHFGQLPDGRFYYVGIPDTLHHYDRNPLVLSLSKDGRVFDQDYVIADELYTLKKEGLWKGGQYGYPHTLVKDGWMYVIISRQKEAIEVLRFRLDQLNR